MYRLTSFNAYGIQNYPREQRTITEITESALLDDVTVSLKEAVLCLMYYCNLISVESIYRYIYPSESISTVKLFLTRLKNSGLTKSISLSSVDNNTRKVYALTKKGYEYSLSFLRVLSESDFKEFSLTPKTIHDYSAGLNTLALVNLKNSHIDYLSEYTFKNDIVLDKKETNNIVRPDVTCRFSDITERNYFGYIFVEQDMGTEGIQILLDKILSYLFSGILVRNNMNALVFSFRVNGNLSAKKKKSAVRDIKSLSRCKELMLEHKIKTLYSFYESDFVPEDLQLFIKDFLIETGVIDASNEFDYIQSKDFTIKDIDKYICDADKFCNPFLNRESLKRQYEYSLRKRDTLVNRISVIYEDTELVAAQKTNLSTEQIEGLRKVAYGGVQNFSCATELMLNYVDFFNPYFSKVYNSVVRVILSEYLGQDSLSYRYSVLSDDIFDEQLSYYLSLRNTFTLGNGDTLSFEHSHDIFAWYRIAYFIEGKEQVPTLNRHFLFIVVDSVEDAYSIAKKYRISSGCQEMDSLESGYYIFFIEATSFRQSESSLVRYIRKDVFYHSPIFVFPDLNVKAENRLYLYDS